MGNIFKENISGFTFKYVGADRGNPFAPRNKMKEQTQIVAGNRQRIMPQKQQSKFIEDVDLLVNSLNDRAFIYNSGKIDVLKNGGIISRRFPNKKDASLYLLKTGWNYVR